MIDLNAQPPVDIAAEMGVVGSLLINPATIFDIGDLEPSDFHDPAIATVFEHVRDMHASGCGIDAVTLANRLKAAGEFERIGGHAMLVRIGRSVANAAHAVYYADIVRRDSDTRRALAAVTEVYPQLLSGAALQETLQRLQGSIDAIKQRSASQTVVTAREAAERTVQRVIENHGTERPPGIATGIEDLDEQTGGLRRGELCVLAARPAVGKSAWSLQAARSVAERGERVLFASLEMSADELVARQLASVAGVNSQRIRNNRMFPTDIEKIRSSVDGFPETLLIDDSTRQSVSSIRATAHRMKQRGGLSLVVVDYIGRVTPADPRQPRHEQIGNIAADLKQLARDVNTPVLALCQIRREAERNGKESRPKLSDLRESGRIEEEADVVMMIHRGDEPESQREVELIVAKNRNGPTPTIRLDWDASRTLFLPAMDWRRNGGEPEPEFEAEYNDEF